MFSEENATVLLFRDAALRRPIGVVPPASMERPGGAAQNAPADVISLARFARSRRARRALWQAPPPEGEAA